jgi:transcription elongation GreA/GreB family factor
MQKDPLYQQCIEILKDRVSQAIQSMDDAQQSANSETKSSAGDKYETGRAMAHLDKERHTRRHAAALDALTRLQRLRPDGVMTEIELGALVETNLGWYYLTVGIGEVEFENIVVQVISPESPIGSLLLEMDLGDVDDFRGREIEILSVC